MRGSLSPRVHAPGSHAPRCSPPGPCLRAPWRRRWSESGSGPGRRQQRPQLVSGWKHRPCSVAVVSPRPAASRHVWPMRRAGEGPSGRRRSAGHGAGRRTCRVAHAADASAAQLLVHGGSFYVEFPSFHRFKASSGFTCGRIQEKQSRLLNQEGDETLWAVGGAGRLCPPGCGPGRPPWRWLWSLCFFLGCFST